MLIFFKRVFQLKNRKRRADDPTCPVCNERVPDDINLHVELCLRRHERNNGSSSAAHDDDDDDMSIDVEGESYEEYEWAGQTRVRASSFLEGGYSAAGTATKRLLLLKFALNSHVNHLDYLLFDKMNRSPDGIGRPK